MSANPSPDQTRVRPYHEGDERELVLLFQRVFGKAITEQHWRWKLHASGAAVDNVWLAFDGERPVFQYAGIPQRWSIEGRERIGVEWNAPTGSGATAVPCMAASHSKHPGK